MTSGKNESPGPLPIDVQIQVDQQPGESVSITIESLSADGVPIETEVTPSPWVKKSRPSLLTVLIPERLKPAHKPVKIPQPTVSVAILPKVDLAASSRSISLEMTLFGLSLLTYLSTRLIGLVNFPIYFFTDEAIQTVLASDFVRDHFHNYDGDFFPTFFVNGGQYNLGTSVYLQIIPYLLLGKSVWVTRGIAVLATLMAAISVSLALRSIFKVRYWWAGTLVLSVIPAWFLHSRTAFETGLMVSLYAVFLFFYLLYRNRSPRYLYAALVFGALVIYTYSPGQMVMLVTGVLAGYNVFMLRDALVNGPTWFKDYGLGGMQYGADQIFGEIKNYFTRAGYKDHPDPLLVEWDRCGGAFLPPGYDQGDFREHRWFHLRS